jgi:hypothetical protein
MARALRLLDRCEESLSILLPLVNEYDAMIKSGKLDMPAEILPFVRGLIYEELAEIYGTKAKDFSKKAYEDLSKDEWFKKLEPARLERLKQQQE